MSSIVHMYAGHVPATNHLGVSVGTMARWSQPIGSAWFSLRTTHILRSDG